jgi:hypothetical protein
MKRININTKTLYLSNERELDETFVLKSKLIFHIFASLGIKNIDILFIIFKVFIFGKILNK